MLIAYAQVAEMYNSQEQIQNQQANKTAGAGFADDDYYWLHWLTIT